MSGVLSLVFGVFFLAALFLLEDSFPLKPYIYWSEAGAAIACLGVWIFSGGIRKLSKEREKRVVVFTSGTLLYLGMALPLFAAINYVSAKNEVFFVDLSKEGVFSLSPQSKKILESIDQKVQLQYFATPPSDGNRNAGRKYDKIVSLLQRVAAESDHVSLDVLDPEKNILLVEQLRVTEDSTLQISLTEHPEKRWAQLAGRITEEQVFNALKRLVLDKRLVLYATRGFGEGNLTEDFAPFLTAIEGEGFEAKYFELSLEVPVPEEASAVLILAPKQPYTEKALSILKDYIQERKGNVIIFDEPRHNNNLNELLSVYDVKMAKQLLVRPTEVTGEVRLDLPVNQLLAHPVAKKVDGQIKAATAQMVELTNNSTLQPFFFAPFGSWEEVDEAASFSKPPYKAVRGPKERTGNLALSAISPPEVKEGRAAVFGDIDFIALRNINVGYNKQLILNTLSWITGRENYVEIRPKGLRESVQPIDDNTAAAMFLVSSLIVPQLLLVLGVYVWWRK